MNTATVELGTWYPDVSPASGSIVGPAQLWHILEGHVS